MKVMPGLILWADSRNLLHSGIDRNEMENLKVGIGMINSSFTFLGNLQIRVLSIQCI